MLIKESVGWNGMVRVTTVGQGALHVAEFENLITDAALNLVRDVLAGVQTDAGVRYMAVGTDATVPTKADVKLGAEIFRTAVSSRNNGTGSLVESASLQPDDAVASIREIGWFAGTTATVAQDSGVLIARVLYAQDKTNLVSVYIDRTETLGRLVNE